MTSSMFKMLSDHFLEEPDLSINGAGSQLWGERGGGGGIKLCTIAVFSTPDGLHAI